VILSSLEIWRLRRNRMLGVLGLSFWDWKDEAEMNLDYLKCAQAKRESLSSFQRSLLLRSITTMSSTCASTSSLATPPPTISILSHLGYSTNKGQTQDAGGLHLCVKPSSLLKCAVIKRTKKVCLIPRPFIFRIDNYDL
jgi:hypothetical protein